MRPRGGQGISIGVPQERGDGGPIHDHQHRPLNPAAPTRPRSLYCDGGGVGTDESACTTYSRRSVWFQTFLEWTIAHNTTVTPLPSFASFAHFGICLGS